MSENEDNDKATEPTTRSGKTRTKGAKQQNKGAISKTNVVKDNTESEGTMEAESNVNTVETRETNVNYSERDHTMTEMMRLLMEMREELNEVKSAMKARSDGVHTRSRQTVRYGNVEFPVNIETGSAIGNDGGSNDGEPIPESGSGGNGGNGGNGTGVTLRIPRSGWMKDPFEELRFYGETDKQNPVIFLRRFENVARYEGIQREQQLYDFKRVLKGAAKHWIEAINPSDIESAKKLF